MGRWDKKKTSVGLLVYYSLMMPKYRYVILDDFNITGMPMRRASCTSGSASVFSAMASELAAMRIRVTTFLSKYQSYVTKSIPK